MWKRLVKDYYSFSSSDRNGLILLTFLIMGVISGTYLIPLFDFTSKKIDLTNFQNEISLFYSHAAAEDEKLLKNRSELFYFDPNKLTMIQMEKLGLNKSLARTIENYLEKGGRFRDANDLLKIYGMNDSVFKILKPFVSIEKDVSSSKRITKQEALSDKINIIELNSADTNQLKSLHGLGSVLSGRIVRYRDLLGGFCKIDQLKEVYGISPELFEKIKPFFTIDEESLSQLKINQITFNEILRHPYISYEQAVMISGYLRKHGYILYPEVLLEEQILDSIAFEKLRPYLATEVK